MSIFVVQHFTKVWCLGGSVCWDLISEKADNWVNMHRCKDPGKGDSKEVKETERKKGQSKVGMKVELVARSWIGNCESVRGR